jgi:predicted nucleic acid-binding protein
VIRALIDTDVLLDVLLARDEFVESAELIWRANLDGKFEGYISAISPINIFYIARKLNGQQIAQELNRKLLLHWRICPVDGDVLRKAADLPIKDFEDAVQCANALALNLEYVVTRNTSDYADAPSSILTPVEFVRLIG